MRVRLPLGRSLFFLLFFLLALVALLPLRLAAGWLGLEARGVAAREARGSIWLGSLIESQLGSVALGDLQARMRTLPLLVGRARIDVERADDSRRFTGSVTLGRHRFGIDDMTGDLAIGSALAPLSIASLDLSDVSAHFADGLCSSAEGLVRASIAGEVAGLPLPGGLSGNARCDDGALLLPMAGQSGTEALELRLWESGRYTVELAIKPVDDAMRDRLIAAGFRLTANGGYALRVVGAS